MLDTEILIASLIRFICPPCENKTSTPRLVLRPITTDCYENVVRVGCCGRGKCWECFFDMKMGVLEFFFRWFILFFQNLIIKYGVRRLDLLVNLEVSSLIMKLYFAKSIKSWSNQYELQSFALFENKILNRYIENRVT